MTERRSHLTEVGRLVKWRLGTLKISSREAAKMSGGLVSHSTVDSLATGRHVGIPTDKTVEGLALGLDIPLEVVQRARQADRGAHLPDRTHTLSQQSLDALAVVADALIAEADAARRRQN